MTDAKSIPSDLLDQLQRLSLAACVIDVPAAMAVWANENARRALELVDLGNETGDQRVGSWRLDPKSPALDQLANLQQAAGPADAVGCGVTIEMLAFRTGTGVKRFSCRCRMLNEIGAGLVLITAAARRADDDHPKDIAGADVGESLRPLQNDKVARGASWLEQSRRAGDTPRQRQTIKLADEAGKLADAADQPADEDAGNRGHRSAQTTGTLQDMATLQEIARRIREDRREDSDDFVAPSSRLRAANDAGEMTSAPGASMTPPANAAPTQHRPMIVVATGGDEATATSEQRPSQRAINGVPASPGNSLSAEVAAAPLAQLAHELRTPISAIHTAAAIMAQEKFGPIDNLRYKSYAQDIEQSAAHALEVITGMLNPESLRTGRPHLEFTQVDLDVLVRDTLGAMAPLAEKANVDLSGKLVEALPHVIADARAVKQMLLNLLANAVKFTGPGGRITVTTGFEANGPVHIEVRDNGPGMSQRQIKAIMNGPGGVVEPQLRRPGAGRNGGGLGLGLPLTLSLARANNAELRLVSAGDKGRDDAGLSATIIFPKDRTLAAW